MEHKARRGITRSVVTLAVAAVCALSSCSNGPSVGEYAEEIEDLVATMNAGLDDLEPLIADQSPPLEDVREYIERRVALREGFLAAIRELEPPARLEDFHNMALDVIERLTEAEAAMAAEVNQIDDPARAVDLWNTEAGKAALVVDQESLALCRAAEEELSSDDEAVIAGDVPWIPAEMKEVVRVAFLCERSERP